MSRRGRLLIVAVAALIGLGLFWQSVWSDLDRSVLSRVPMLDEAFYLGEGVAIADGRLLPGEPFFMSPLYPYLVALTGSGRALDANNLRIGPPPHGIRILQTLLWLGTGLLLLWAGRRLVGGPAWWLPAALFWLYRTGAILAGSVLLEVPLTFLATLALCLLTLPEDRPGRARDLLLIGVVIGLAGLMRGVALLLWLPAALYLAGIFDGRGAARRWRPVLLMSLGLLLVVSPVVLHNTLEAGRPTGLSLNLGLNLYLGNGPDAHGGFRVLPGFDAERDPAGIAYLDGRTDTPIRDLQSADRHWRDETFAHLRAHPVRAAGLWLAKLRMHFAGLELPQISLYESWTRHAPWLRALPVPWLLLSAAGLAGLGLYGWREPRLRVWLLGLMLLASAHSLFFIVSRYRLVTAPLLALAAGLLLARLLRAGLRDRLIGLAVLAVALVALMPWGYGDLQRQLHASGLMNEAVRWQHLGSGEIPGSPAQLGAWREGERLYRGAIDEASEIAPAYDGLARIRFLLGDLAGAETILKQGIATVADPGALREALTRLYLELDMSAEALPLLDLMLRDRPDDPDLLHNYAVALAGTDRPTEAANAARRLIEAAPNDPRGYIDLGVVLARSGRLEEARQVFAAGLDAVPGHPALQSNLERLDAMLEK